MRKAIFAFMTAVLLAGNSNAVYASGIPDVGFMETSETEALATEGVSEASSLPEEYTSPYVTSIKSQSPYGTCWAFAAMAVSESNIWKKGLADGSIDLAEWQIAYFLGNSVTDPLGGTKGDQVILKNNYLHTGGQQRLTTFRLASWVGVTDEKYAPYSTVVSDATATLDTSLAYGKDSYHLENAYWIPMTEQDQIKQLILECGACATAYYDSYTYYNDPFTTDTEERVAYYCPDDTQASNHAITIIGWDDHYSRENFGTDKPEADGAWLCKNSWGTSFSKDGLFYISYEDASMAWEEGYFFDYGAADNYDHNYQYDGGLSKAYIFATDSANVFTAAADESLKAVGFYTLDPQYTCTIEVYKDCTKWPAKGTLVSTITVTEPYAGYHTVPLSTTVELKQGEKYSVVIKCKSADGKSVKASIDKTVDDDFLTSTSAAEPGESYILVNRDIPYYDWIDISEDGENCRIKAFTDLKETPSVDPVVRVTGLTLNKTEASLQEGASIQLTAGITPANAINKKLNWWSSTPAVATVDSTGKVTAVAAGSAVITCSATDGSGVTATCKVTVTKPEVKLTRIALNKANASIEKGKILQLKATVTPDNATNKAVIWTSSNTKIATVSSSGKVTAKAAGTVTITCTAKDGSGKKATCKVTVTNPVVKVTKVTLNKTKAALSPKETLTLKATVTPTNATNRAVTWTSSNTKIATVSSTGKVTAKAAGTVTITCTAKDGSGKKATCKITVYNNTQAYVARIYTKALGREAEPAGLNYWVAEISTKRRTPVQVAEEFFFAPEFVNKKLNNTEYVKVLYRTFMGREYDKDGLDYWVARLNKGESRKSVLEAFAGCPEFQKIVKSFGL